MWRLWLEYYTISLECLLEEAHLRRVFIGYYCGVNANLVRSYLHQQSAWVYGALCCPQFSLDAQINVHDQWEYEAWTAVIHNARAR